MFTTSSNSHRSTRSRKLVPPGDLVTTINGRRLDGTAQRHPGQHQAPQADQVLAPMPLPVPPLECRIIEPVISRGLLPFLQNHRGCCPAGIKTDRSLRHIGESVDAVGLGGREMTFLQISI